MSKTSIEWTEHTWNPVTGCTKVSPGCKNCYAERMAMRCKAMGQAKYRNGFKVTCHPDALDIPLRRRVPTMYFVVSMGDLIHEDVPFAFIDKAFAVMALCPRHTFQLLTKRPERTAEYCKRVTDSKPHDEINFAVFDAVNAVFGEFATLPLSNVWLGTSVENQETADERIPHLLKCPAAVRFLSVEPMLGPIPDLDLNGIHWVIVGGESGPGARPMDPEWPRSIRDQCQAASVPFFFKQWGGVNKKTTGRVLDGRTWDELPATAKRKE